MKRKRKLKKSIKILLVLIILLFLFFIFKDNGNTQEHVDNNISTENTNYGIVSESESDADVIKEVFANGMNVESYKEIFTYKPTYIKDTGEYETINYNFEEKLHYSDLESIYKKMANSNIVDVMIIGQSADNRNIYGIEVGKGDKVIFLDANVHAAEVANTLILTRFLTEIINNYEDGDIEITNMLNSFKLAIIPSINPDGYEVYNYGVDSLNNKNLWIYKNKDKINFENLKSNANGVDLNRNFPTQNAGLYYNNKKLINSVSFDKTYKGGIYFGGYEVGSEPETKAVMFFAYKHYKNIVKYINMHSQGRVIYAGKPNLSNEFNDLTIKFAKNIAKINKYTVYGLSSEEVGEGNDGSVTDFMAELANGFVFSSKTGRLSSDKYVDNSCEFKYKYPVITLETIRTYTTDTSVFKTEYYDYNIRDMLYSLFED